MAEAYVGEVRIFGFNYAPNGWAICSGQLMAIQQNTALFSLLGTNYGGDGARTFGLPNCKDNVAIGAGNSPSVGTSYALGEMGGQASVTLTSENMGSHTHTFQTASFRETATQNAPGPKFVFGVAENCTPYIDASITTPTIVKMSPTALSMVGTQGPHKNMMPYNTLNFCISLSGIFPQRP